ncbi:hypothetical protein KR009_001487 [Drosophila setifemur]|nr:hypothetical protein KR009_001487 [Drosophila setifemur]
MAKRVGARSACAQIAILLAVCSAIRSTAAWSNPETYQTFDTPLPALHTDGVVRLTTDQLARHRRAAATEVPPSDTKSQYQNVGGNNGPAVTETTVTTVDSKAASAAGSVSYNVHNVGVNGAGQRKDYSVQSGDGAITTPVPKKPTLLLAAQGTYPKKVAPSSTTTPAPAAPAPPGIDVDVSNVDVPEDEIEKAAKNDSEKIEEEHHEYYNSLLYVNKEEAGRLWAQLKNTPENTMLSSSHRRAMTVELKFDFPFYGHYVRNITVATGGFLYTGEYVHSWLAATQYIAPLMANFDTSISQDSFVRVLDNGTAFTAVWENVTLQDKPDFGRFTFSVTLHKSGDIVFGYYQVPTKINSIQDNQHPVKVGLSDAYILDKQLIVARRKTIYEYHRVSFQQQEVTNSTIIKLTALPTCLGYNDCQSCINHNTTFTCLWCPALNRCSTGTDRKKHEWIQKGCDNAAIHGVASCPALGDKGNNAAQMKNGTANGSGASNGSAANNTANSAGSSSSSSPSGTSPSSSTASSASPAVTEPTVVTPRSTAQSKGDEANYAHDKLGGNAELSQAGVENESVGVAFGFLVPICLVSAITLWLFYAYRNPHTRSGQLLIQFRPSQWSWRRGEARYTAATIHM